MDRGRDRSVRDVLGRFHQLLDLPDLVAHGSPIVHEASRSPRACRRRRASATSKRDAARRARVAPAPRARAPASPSSARQLGEDRRPRTAPACPACPDRPAPRSPCRSARQRLAAAPATTSAGSARLVAEGDERGAGPRLQRGRADGDRRALPVLRPRVRARSARPGPSQRRPHAASSWPVTTTRSSTWAAAPRRPAHDRLAAKLQQELLAAPCAARTPPPDTIPAITVERCRRRARPRTPRDPEPRAARHSRRTDGSSERVEPALDRGLDGARLANTRHRCDLYSTEPCRSACTSTPSAAFWAAASMVAASSFLPTSARLHALGPHGLGAGAGDAHAGLRALALPCRASPPPPRRRRRSARPDAGTSCTRRRCRPASTGTRISTRISSSPQRRRHQPLEPVVDLHRAPALGALAHDLGAERDHRGRHVRGGVGVGERAADRAQVAHGRIADDRRPSRARTAHFAFSSAGRLHLPVRGHGADDDARRRPP